MEDYSNSISYRFTAALIFPTKPTLLVLKASLKNQAFLQSSISFSGFWRPCIFLD